MTVRQWLDGASARLAGAGDPEARLTARWLLADAMGISPARLILVSNEELEGAAWDRAQGWLAQRLTGRPLQYVEGRAWFMGYEFFVDERALIPRQDSELLCERAIARAGQGTGQVLDLCTGSGALAVSIKLKRPLARVWASDLSEGALSLAAQNARRLGAQVEFLRGDLFTPVAGMKFDLIACNPPYLSGADMRVLQKEVSYEPAMALYGGEDGLDFYRRLAVEAPAYLKRGGYLLLEVGAGQASQVCHLLGGGCAVYRDLAGIERVVEKQF